MDRTTFGDRLEGSASPYVRSLGAFVRDGASGVLPCWGNVADLFAAVDVALEDRVALFDVLREVGDRLALLLFVETHADRPDVLERVVAVMGTLPVTVQCALVASPSVDHALFEGATMHPSASELLASTAERRAEEHAMYLAHAESLRSLRLCPEPAS